MRRELVALAALLVAATATAFAQPAPSSTDDDNPTPPPLRTTGLVPVEVGGSSLRFGIDPQSVQVAGDTVRYVVVASSPSGAVNAMYEGIRCEKADVRTYARHFADGGWTAAKDEWRSLYDGPATRHSLAIARSGVCRDKAPNGSPAQIVQDLRLPDHLKFGATSR